MAVSVTRDFEKQPYNAKERRVAEYLWNLTNGMVGGGDDPIGFLIVSHRALGNKLSELIEFVDKKFGVEQPPGISP